MLIESHLDVSLADLLIQNRTYLDSKHKLDLFRLLQITVNHRDLKIKKST